MYIVSKHLTKVKRTIDFCGNYVKLVFMRILIVNWRDNKNPLYGGAEIHITKIAEYLARNHDVYFLSSGFEGGLREESVNGVNYIRMGSELIFNYYVMASVGRIVSDLRIDLVIEDINKVPFFTPLFTRAPVLVVIPHIFGKSIFSQVNFLSASYVYLMEKPVKKVYRNSRYEVISQSTKKDLISRGINGAKIEVIECGIDPLKSSDREYGKSEFPTFAYVGRLKKYKSVHHIIDAMPLLLKKYPQSKLYIVGSGDMLEFLKRRASERGVEKSTVFTGYVSEEEKKRILSRSWVSIYPSMIEGWGIVNIEANILGTPVVSSDVQGLRDSVKNGFSGLLYRYGDIEDMAEKIAAIIDDRGKFDDYCRNALSWAESFDWEETGRRTESLINAYIDK